MAFKYQISGDDGRVVDFEMPYQITEEMGVQIANRRLAELDAQAAALEEKASGWRSPFEFIADTGLALGKGVLGLGQTGADILDLAGITEPTPEGEKGLFEKGQEYLDELKSDEMLAREALFQQEMARVGDDATLGEQVTATLSALATSPSMVVQMAAEQVPQLIPIAKAGKLARVGLQKALPKATEKALNRAGVTGALATAGAMQGSSIGMQTYDRVYKQYIEKGATEEEAAMIALDEAQKDALQAGAVTLVTGAAIPGAASVEKLITGGSGSLAKTAAGALKDGARTRGTLRAVTGEAIQEGAEEGAGQLISNLSAIEAGEQTSPLAKVGEQATLGGVIGGVFGGPAGFLQGSRDARAAAQDKLMEQVVADAKAKKEAEEAKAAQYSVAPEATVGPDLPAIGLPSPETVSALPPETVPATAQPELAEPKFETLAPVDIDDATYVAVQNAKTLAEKVSIIDNEMAMLADEAAKPTLGYSPAAINSRMQQLAFLKNRVKADAKRPIAKEGKDEYTLRRVAKDMGKRIMDETGRLEREGKKTKAFTKAINDLVGLNFTKPEDVQAAETVLERLNELAQQKDGQEFKYIDSITERLTERLKPYKEAIAARDAAATMGVLEEQIAADQAELKIPEGAKPEDLNADDIAAAIEYGMTSGILAEESVDTDAQQREQAFETAEAKKDARKEAEMEQGWKDMARRQLEQPTPTEEELQAFEVSDFELDMQVVDEYAPALYPEEKVSATDLLNRYSGAKDTNNTQAIEAIEAEAKAALGDKTWASLKGGLTKRKNQQIRALRAEVSGRVPKDGQMDLFAQADKQVQRNRRAAEKKLREDKKVEVDTVEATEAEKAAIEAAVEADRVNAEQKAEIKAYDDAFAKAMKRSAKNKGAAKVMDGEYIYRGYHIQRGSDGAWNVGGIKDGKPTNEFDDAAGSLTDAKAIVDNYIEPEVVEDAEPTVRETEMGRRKRRNDKQSTSESSMEVDDGAVDSQSETAKEPTPPKSGGMADTERATRRTTGGTVRKPVTLKYEQGEGRVLRGGGARGKYTYVRNATNSPISLIPSLVSDRASGGLSRIRWAMRFPETYRGVNFTPDNQYLIPNDLFTRIQRLYEEDFKSLAEAQKAAQELENSPEFREVASQLEQWIDDGAVFDEPYVAPQPTEEEKEAERARNAKVLRGLIDRKKKANEDQVAPAPAPETTTEENADILESFGAAFTTNTVESVRELIADAKQQKLISSEEAESFRKTAAIGKKSRMGVMSTLADRLIDAKFFKGNPVGALEFKEQVEKFKRNAAIDVAAKKIDAELEADFREAMDSEKDDFPFRRGSFADNNFSTVAEIEAAAGKLIRRLRGTIDVKVVQSRSDLPAEINAPAGVKGVYHNGTAYIIADNVPVAEVQTVLMHETVGHAGLESILDKGAFKSLLSQVNKLKNTNPRIQRVLANIKRMYTDPQGNYNLNEETEAREILAFIAEGKTELLTDSAIRRVWNNLVQMFRRAMGRLGFMDPADVLLDQLIYEAAQHMQGGKHASRDRRFIRHDYMAAHTMQRAWDMGYRGTDLGAAGRHIKGVLNGSIEVPALTEEEIFAQEIEHDFIDQAVFSRGPAIEPAEQLDQETNDLLSSRGRPQPTPKGMAASLREILREKGAVGAARRGLDYVRVMMFDSAATLEDKLMKSYSNAMSKGGFINPMVPYVQALRAEGMAMEVLRTGGLRVDDNGLWEAVSIDGVSSMQDVYNELQQLGLRIGADKAQDLFHMVTIAQRELEIEENNRKYQEEADAIREKGGKNAEKNAKAKEDKIVNLHPTRDEAWQSARDAENKNILKYFDKYPELRRAHDHFISTKDALVDVLEEVGYLSKDKAAELKEAVGYVPFDRLVEGENENGFDVKSTGLMRVGSLGTLHGSLLEVDNILDNMTKKIVWMTQTAMRVRAANELIRGLGDKDVDGIAGYYDTEEEVPTAEQAGLITYYKDGVMKYATTRDPLDAYAFRGNESISLPLLRMLAGATDWLRKGITLSPEFIIGQWQQDSIRAFAMGGTKNGLKTAANVTSSYAKIRANLWRGGFGDENLNRYGIQGMYDATAEHNKELIDAQIDPTKKRGFWKTLVDFGEHNAEASDLAQRKAVYDQTILETGDPVLAFWRASEVINFNRRGAGKTASILRQLIPFQNAYFQGMSILLKSMMGRGLQQDQKAMLLGRFWNSMLTMATLNFMYAMAMSDDDDYVNQPAHVRSRYLQVPVGGDLNVKVAMPADLAFFFKAIPEAIAMGIGPEQADSKKIADFVRHSMYEAIAGPSSLPQFAKPVIEVATNHSFFTDAPIVSQGMLNREVQDRFDENTSQLARVIGKTGLIAPKNADHIIKGFGGTLAGSVLTLGDLAVESATGQQRADRELADLPVTRALFLRTAPSGFKQDFYALRKNMREVYGSYKEAFERGDFERAQEILEDKPELLQLRKAINSVDKVIKDSNARIKKINKNPSLSSAQKREMIDMERDRQSRMAAQVRRLRRYAYD